MSPNKSIQKSRSRCTSVGTSSAGIHSRPDAGKNDERTAVENFQAGVATTDRNGSPALGAAIKIRLRVFIALQCKMGLGCRASPGENAEYKSWWHSQTGFATMESL